MVCELTAHARGTAGTGAAVAVALAIVETHPRATTALTIHTNLPIPASSSRCTPERAGDTFRGAKPGVNATVEYDTNSWRYQATLTQTGQPGRSRSRRRRCFPWAGPNSVGSGRSLWRWRVGIRRW